MRTGNIETGDVKAAIAYPLSIRESVIGDRNFYRRVLMVVVPMIIQNTLSNIVSLLDNVMVGQVGTLPMSAVAIVNQLFFVFYLCIWGSLAGAGIYGTQFYGSGDYDGMRQTFRYKLIDIVVILTGALLIFSLFGEKLIGLYMTGDTTASEAALTLGYAKNYLHIMLPGLIPFAITQVYAGTLREAGETSLPMKASMIAMTVNFVFNGLLIFGLFFFPKLGVSGAAIATVISRVVEMLIVVISANRAHYPFLSEIFSRFRIDGTVAANIFAKSMPLLANEFLWSMGQAVLLQCYSVRGIAVIAAMNIANTISQIFNEIFLSLGNATSIIVGQELGANRLVNARRSAWRMIALAQASCLVMGALLFLASGFIPQIYNTEPEIRSLATSLIRVIACTMPIHAFANAAYFTIRSGGKTFITFLFDACFTWAVDVVAVFLMTRYTDWYVVRIYITAMLLDLIKCAIGFVMVKKGIWVRNIVHKEEA